MIITRCGKARRHVAAEERETCDEFDACRFQDAHKPVVWLCSAKSVAVSGQIFPCPFNARTLCVTPLIINGALPRLWVCSAKLYFRIKLRHR